MRYILKTEKLALQSLGVPQLSGNRYKTIAENLRDIFRRSWKKKGRQTSLQLGLS
jgi:hypothetical protein